MSLLKKTVLQVFPATSARGRAVKRTAVKLKLAKPFHYDPAYQQWMEVVEPYTFNDPLKNFVNPIDKDKPLFSIVIPAWNTEQKYLLPLIDSIVSQSFGDWELILADGSTIDERQEAIEDISHKDPRIKYHKLSKNGGISDNTNQGLEFAKGSFVVFMDHDDTLAPAALNELAIYIANDLKVEIIYTDEDKLTDDGLWRHSPHFKPDWAPHQFMNCNYTNHLSAIRSDLVKKAGGLDTAHNGAQDYEFLLRVHGLPGERVVGHIPKVLYHWRQATGSTAAVFDVKAYAIEAGRSALEKYLKNRKLNVSVAAVPNRPGFYEPRIVVAIDRKALVIIDGEDSLYTNSFRNRLQEMTTTDEFKSVDFVTNNEFEKNKEGLLKTFADDDCLVRINDFILPTKIDWLERLCGILELKEVKAVAPRIIAFDGHIWDMGIIIDAEGKEQHIFRGLRDFDDTQFGHSEWIRDVDALTGNFTATRKKQSGEYNVIWSPVVAKYMGSRRQKSPRFNENLSVMNKGHISVLWKRK
ncbi:MAG: glycosyltransferase, group 2 family protein [Candidatus Saccharibacteria bacterium]|nr:glycosyltransferase, group 2 family protein [Candidatus Saccharibacteria bacterium]